MSEPEPIKELSQATVVTDEYGHTNAMVELYRGWIHVFTDRHDETTEPELWIPNERVIEVQP